MYATGQKEGKWAEYEETPFGHSKGYFWLRSDGLRFGYRLAGSYYKPGTTPEKPEPPFHPLNYPAWHPKRGDHQWWTNASYADGAYACDIIGELREESKKETLPSHLRVMKNGVELELISKIDGIDLEIMLAKKDFDVFAFVDKRFPIERTIDAKTEPEIKSKPKPKARTSRKKGAV